VEPDLTVLAGRNNVGKTAYLHGLTLPTTNRPGRNEATFELALRWTVAGDELRAALQVGQWSAGSVSDQLRSAASFTVECRLQPAQPATSLPGASQEVPGDSIIVVDGQPNLQVTDLKINGGLLALTRKQRPHQHPPSGQFVWVDGTDTSLFPVGTLPQLAFQLCQRLLGSIAYVGPRRIGSYRISLVPQAIIVPDGSNLVNVLAHLYINRRYDIYPLVEEFIREAFPEILRLEVNMPEATVATAEVYVVYPGNPPQSILLEHCGTGIEQLLVLSCAILSSPGSRVFLIDEPHAFLHPHAERTLLKLMREHPEHQYIVATHSSIFLRTAQLHRIRLLTRGETGTVIQLFEREREILNEIGLTAADVWSSRAILWVEGQTEVGIYDVLGAAEPDLLEGITVKEMPDYLRNARTKPADIAGIVGLLSAISNALSPFGVRTRFLFDRDELPVARRDAVMERAGDGVVYHDCREVENLLLHLPSITVVLNKRRGELGLEVVAEDTVSRRFDQLRADVANRDLYPGAPSQPDLAGVSGSRLLTELFASFDKLTYDKVRQGRALAAQILVLAPEKLEPLRDVVRSLHEDSPFAATS